MCIKRCSLTQGARLGADFIAARALQAAEEKTPNLGRKYTRSERVRRAAKDPMYQDESSALRGADSAPNFF
jgi:hypothetical protein